MGSPTINQSRFRPLTPLQLKACGLLAQDYFLRGHVKMTGTKCWRMLTPDIRPVMNLSTGTFGILMNKRCLLERIKVGEETRVVLDKEAWTAYHEEETEAKRQKEARAEERRRERAERRALKNQPKEETDPF